MKVISKPVLGTVVSGMVFSILFIFIIKTAKFFFYEPDVLFLFIYFCFVAYEFYLVRHTGTKIKNILFPMVLPLLFLLREPANMNFIYLTLIIFCWIRSGICFNKPLHKIIIAEFLTCAPGIALFILFKPSTISGWAICIWMFFLLQSFYFIFFSKADDEIINIECDDTFNSAKKSAEKILSSY